MFSILIALDGSSADEQVLQFAGRLLAGREVEIRLLHVLPVPTSSDPGQRATVVLEGYFAAHACGSEVAPLVEQLRTGLQDRDQAHSAAPRLVPRHLIHQDDLFDVTERCGIARARQASLTLLATAAQRLQQHGLSTAILTRDSAIGNPADVVRDTARHFGVDLVLMGSRNSSRVASTAEDGGPLALSACPVLVVPATDEVRQSAAAT